MKHAIPQKSLPPLMVPIGTTLANDGNSVSQFIDANAVFRREFACRIRTSRTNKGMSKATLSRRASVSREIIDLAESRPWEVPFAGLIAIADALGDSLQSYSEGILAEN